MVAGSLLLAAMLFGHPVAGSATPSLDEVRGKLAAMGPRATVRDLHDHGRLGYVLNRIGTGDRQWIALAPKLARGADGADSEGLTVALAEALPRNARTVIAALDLHGPPSLSPERVCGAPFIEPKPGVVQRHKALAIRAVQAVHGQPLAQASAACLTRLQAIPG